MPLRPRSFVRVEVSIEFDNDTLPLREEGRYPMEVLCDGMNHHGWALARHIETDLVSRYGASPAVMLREQGVEPEPGEENYRCRWWWEYAVVTSSMPTAESALRLVDNNDIVIGVVSNLRPHVSQVPAIECDRILLYTSTAVNDLFGLRGFHLVNTGTGDRYKHCWFQSFAHAAREAKPEGEEVAVVITRAVLAYEEHLRPFPPIETVIEEGAKGMPEVWQGVVEHEAQVHEALTAEPEPEPKPTMKT